MFKLVNKTLICEGKGRHLVRLSGKVTVYRIMGQKLRCVFLSRPRLKFNNVQPAGRETVYLEHRDTHENVF